MSGRRPVTDCLVRLEPQQSETGRYFVCSQESLKPNGWLSMDYAYALSGVQEYFGIGFDYPEADVKGMRFLGEGPAPVYQNRLAGGYSRRLEQAL